MIITKQQFYCDICLNEFDTSSKFPTINKEDKYIVANICVEYNGLFCESNHICPNCKTAIKETLEMCSGEQNKDLQETIDSWNSH